MPLEQSPVSIDRVEQPDVAELLPLMRAYCDFYGAAPREDRLVALARTLTADRSEGVQFLARRRDDAIAVGFATVFWTWSTLDAGRVGLMHDLYVAAGERGAGIGAGLIEACRGACRKRGVGKLVWDTASDNEPARRLYDALGATSSTWVSYELEAW